MFSLSPDYADSAFGDHFKVKVIVINLGLFVRKAGYFILGAIFRMVM